MNGAMEPFYLSVVAFGDGRFAEAAEHARRATELDPASSVFREAAVYLARVVVDGKSGVYVTGEAFGAFIRGGSNTRLYRATSAALGDVYSAFQGADLLDIGTGDGLALLPALNDCIRRVTLVEPSAAMLESTLAALRGRGITHEAANVTLQQFVRDDASACWDLGQATFSLHNIPPAERAPLFVWLRRKVGRLLIAEFDVPVFADMYSPEHVAYVVDRYEKGLLEYAGDGGLVAQGFLMPVFFGNFDRTAARTTYEQPIEHWENELRAAGFGRVERRDLDDYWWARAHLVDAR